LALLAIEERLGMFLRSFKVVEGFLRYRKKTRRRDTTMESIPLSNIDITFLLSK